MVQSIIKTILSVQSVLKVSSTSPTHVVRIFKNGKMYLEINVFKKYIYIFVDQSLSFASSHSIHTLCAAGKISNIMDEPSYG